MQGTKSSRSKKFRGDDKNCVLKRVRYMKTYRTRCACGDGCSSGFVLLEGVVDHFHGVSLVIAREKFLEVVAFCDPFSTFKEDVGFSLYHSADADRLAVGVVSVICPSFQPIFNISISQSISFS